MSHFLNKDDLILNLKKKSNLSIREIAKILGINRGMVSRIKCDREPSLVTLGYTALTLACEILDSLNSPLDFKCNKNRDLIDILIYNNN